MKKEFLLVSTLLILGLLTAAAQSSTVIFQAAPGQRDIWDSVNTPVADGNKVAIGFFDAGFDVSANAGNPDVLHSAWNEYGATEIQTIWFDAGRFSGEQTVMDPIFDNQKIYLWIFNTHDNAPPDNSLANIAEYGLYSSTAPSWLFPQLGVYPDNSVTITSSEVNENFWGSLFTPSNEALLPGGGHLILAPVPEPSIGALLAVGVGTCLLFGRKRRS